MDEHVNLISRKNGNVGRSIYVLGMVLVVILAAYLRFTVIYESKVENELRGDAQDYFLYAYNLNQFGIYSRSPEGFAGKSLPEPDSVRSPGFPLVASFFLGDPPTNSDLLATKIFHAGLGVATVLLSMLFVGYCLGNFWALLVGFLVAANPHLVNINIYYLTEPIALFCLTLAAFLFLINIKRSSVPLWMLIGVVLGYAALTRPFSQYFIVVLTLMILSMPLSNRGYSLSAMWSGYVLLVGVWAARNLLLPFDEGQDILKVNFLVHGMYPDFMYQQNEASFGHPYRYDPNIHEISKNVQSALSEILRRFVSEPAKYLHWYLIGKPSVLWQWPMVASPDIFVYPVSESPYFTKAIFQYSYFITELVYTFCVLLAFLGAIWVWFPGVWKRRGISDNAIWGLRFLSLFLAYFTAIHMVGAPYPRYAIPVKPIMYMLAIVGAYFVLTSVVARFRR